MLYDMLEQEHTAFRTIDGLAVLVSKAPLWIWLAQNRNEGDARLFFRSFLQKNAETLKKEPISGLVAEKKTAMVCADMYLKINGSKKLTFTSQELAAYYLPNEKMQSQQVRNITNASGELRLANPNEWLLIKEWIHSFYSETLNTTLPEALVC